MCDASNIQISNKIESRYSTNECVVPEPVPGANHVKEKCCFFRTAFTNRRDCIYFRLEVCFGYDFFSCSCIEKVIISRRLRPRTLKSFSQTSQIHIFQIPTDYIMDCNLFIYFILLSSVRVVRATCALRARCVCVCS